MFAWNPNGPISRTTILAFRQALRASSNIKMAGSKVIKDPDQYFELIKHGTPIQNGVTWNNSFERKVSDRYQRGGRGGHSTCCFGLTESGNIRHINSWKNWQGDGTSEWTREFVAGIMRHDRTSVFVAYDPTTLEVQPDIIERVENQERG